MMRSLAANTSSSRPAILTRGSFLDLAPIFNFFGHVMNVLVSAIIYTEKMSTIYLKIKINLKKKFYLLKKYISRQWCLIVTW